MNEGYVMRIDEFPASPVDLDSIKNEILIHFYTGHFSGQYDPKLYSWKCTPVALDRTFSWMALLSANGKLGPIRKYSRVFYAPLWHI